MIVSEKTAAVILIKMPERAVRHSVTTFCTVNNIPLHVLEASRPVDIGCSDIPHDHTYLGRTLTCVETAIAHSHLEARATALSLGLEVVIILEDDADVLLSKSELILESIRFARKYGRKSLAIHLYPVQFGILLNSKRANTFNRVALLPDFAVGYVLNRRSLQTWSSSSTRAKRWVADWPLSAYKLRWYAHEEPFLSHPLTGDSDSFAADGRNRRLNDLSRWRRRMNIGSFRLLIFYFFSLFSNPVGATPIPNEKLRTRQIKFQLSLLSKKGKA